ncbi:MAG: TIR domain-containing protein [Paucibacter sp.]|nr:TIR domain-containing protein [Roseateles sp.]
MSDVFISYARASLAQAQQIGALLRAQGLRVWRDDELPAHRAYAEVIAERLAAAKAVLVLWSEQAVASEWVQSEADRARNERKLVQLRLDSCTLPMPFDRIQCADLAGWQGDAAAPGWRKVLDSLASLIENDGGMDAPAATVPVVGASRKPTICVLPFANMSGDAEQEYFSDGISEDIITDLSKVSALSVVSRNTAFQFKGRHVDLRQLARQLAVSHVLEGSVRRAGMRMRITAQLIEAASDSHLWAERYDRELTDIFELQDQISQAIVAALRLKLLPAEKSAIERRGTADAAAYDLYLMARREWLSGNTDARVLKTILRLCLRATDLDPAYARAWALAAMAQVTLYVRHRDTGRDGMALAERALALDPDLAEAHAVKARYLSGQGQLDAADAEIELALRLDPQSYEVHLNAGYVHFRRRRFEAAARCYEAATALIDAAFAAPGMLISCCQAIGDRVGAERAARQTLARAEAAIAQDPGNGMALGFGAGALAVLGDTERARDWVARALLVDPDNRGMRYNLACALAGTLGDLDGALDLLAPYLSIATGAELSHIEADPDMNPLRQHPGFVLQFAAARERLLADAAAKESEARRQAGTNAP